MSRKKLMLAALSLLLFLPSSSLFARKHNKKQAATAVQQMDERERAIHALNRLTFGPRPGDVDRVLAIGVDRWIDQQLAPEKIDDRVLEARLAPYSHAADVGGGDGGELSATAGTEGGCGGKASDAARSAAQGGVCGGDRTVQRPAGEEKYAKPQSKPRRMRICWR